MKRKHILILLLFTGIKMVVATQGYAATYNEIVNNYRSLTDAQFDEYKRGLLDTKVQWEGTVYNVTGNWLDENFEVQIDMNNDNVFDVSFDVGKNNALRLAKNSKVTFSGSIAHVISLFGSIVVTLKDVAIRE